MGSYQKVFRDVLVKEGEAVEKAAPLFGDEVDRACAAIASCEGKLIVIGIGKSGHVGSKIAATFASTGTPSFFLHAAEAAHGDLGMIEKKDVVLFLSNSGETGEVVKLLAPVKALGCCTLAITRSHDSSLAKGVDIPLVYSYAQEADPLNLAPTVSSTLTLAVGDALAIAVSVKKGFSREDFHRSHPGGALGKSLEAKK